MDAEGVAIKGNASTSMKYTIPPWVGHARLLFLLMLSIV